VRCLVAQISKLNDGARLTGLRDHADEDADFGVVDDDSCTRNLAWVHADDSPWSRRNDHTAAMVRSSPETQRRSLSTPAIIPGDDRTPAVGLTRSAWRQFADFDPRALHATFQELTKGDLSVPDRCRGMEFRAV